MTLRDDIAFYRTMYRAGEVTADEAARAVANASNGNLAQARALWWITVSDEELHEREQEHFDVIDAVRALENGRQIPEPVSARIRERSRQRARDQALRMIRRRGTGW